MRLANAMRWHMLNALLMLGIVASVSIFACDAAFADPQARISGPGWWDAPDPRPDRGNERRFLRSRDMVSFAEIGDPGALDFLHGNLAPVSLSVDGARGAAVVRRGSMASGAIEAVLIVYDLSHSHVAPRPILTVEVASLTGYQPLSMVRWLSNDSLTFIATERSSVSRLYRLDISSRRVRRLTSNEEQPLAIEMNQSASAIVLFSKPEWPSTVCAAVACPVEASELAEAQTGVAILDRVFASTAALYDGRGKLVRRIPRPELRDRNIARCYHRRAQVSVDGHWMLQLCQMRAWPSWWQDYTAGDTGAVATQLRHGVAYSALQLYLVNLTSGESRPLTGTLAPYLAWTSADAIWLDGGTRVLIPSALRPLVGLTANERTVAANQLHSLIVNLRTGEIEQALPLPEDTRSVTSANWDQTSRTLTAHAKGRAGTNVITSRLTDVGWQLVSVEPQGAAEDPAAPTLFVAQDLNSRPVLRTRDVIVLDPNRWLDDFRIGRVEGVQFPVANQHWTGRLYFPPDFDASRRYPLVIQTHGDPSTAFSLWGAARHFAAQPLAAHGMIVLELDDIAANANVEGTPQLWPSVVRGYEAAIAEVERRAQIDESRIALVGWSRTTPYVTYTLTHGERPYAAVLIADGLESSWFNYLGIDETRSYMAADYGSTPIGEGLSNWLETAPTFNLNRVRAPLLEWGAGRRDSALWQSWELYQGLRLAGAPVEYWWFPQGTHELFTVRERVQATELLVDWMAFWLQDREDDDLAKTEQYARWRHLRDLKGQLLLRPRPPLLDWTSTRRP
jgi:hypothetical protein